MPPGVLLGLCLDNTGKERTLARSSARSGLGYLSFCPCCVARTVMLADLEAVKYYLNLKQVLALKTRSNI